MQEVKFTLRTLTPLFLAGADPTAAELRAPTFRGLMRYWYRTLIGGALGTGRGDVQQVFKAERAIFGATDVSSSVIIRLSRIAGEAVEFTERVSVNVGGTWQATGKGYLLWSMVRSGNPAKGNVKPARWYFPQRTAFQVTLASRGDESTLLQAIAAFWLLTHLGGVGSRSRRCAGSLTATVAESNVTIPAKMRFDLPANVADLQQLIVDGIHAALEVIRSAQEPIKEEQKGIKRTEPLAPFDVISKETCRIWIVQDRDRPWNSVEEAMKAIGEDLQDYRSRIKPLSRRRVFGLPLKDVDSRRRASPLLLRIAELRGNKYVCIAVVFKTMGDGISPQDYEHVEKWATGFPGSVEVKL